MNFDFDGGQEMLHMENGSRYGLSRIVYWQLASCALACSKYANIEPTTISPLPDHDEPACVLNSLENVACSL